MNKNSENSETHNAIDNQLLIKEILKAFV